MVEGDQLGARPEQHLERLLVQATLLVDGHELQVRVLLLDQQLPGHQVGVVLQLREHDGVRRRMFRRPQE